MQEDHEKAMSAQPELSVIWQELLGSHAPSSHSQIVSGEVMIPTLDSDPWSELLQSQGVEMVELQKVHLHVSDQDVEQVLQVMQEQALQQGEQG